MSNSNSSSIWKMAIFSLILGIALIFLVLVVMVFLLFNYSRKMAEVRSDNRSLRLQLDDLRSQPLTHQTAGVPLEKFALLQAENAILQKRIATLLQEQEQKRQQQESATPSKTVLRIATGEQSGFYYRLGKSLQVSTAASPFQFEVLESPGAAQNIIFVNVDKADLAFVQMDSVLDFKNSPATRNLARSIAFVAPITYEKLHIVVRRDTFPNLARSQFLKFDDFVGKKVNIGAVGSGSRVSCQRLMQTAGTDIEKIQLDSSFFSNSIGKLLHGELDAMCCIMATPSPLFEHLPGEIGQQLKIYSLDPRFLRKVETTPDSGYAISSIRAGTYVWEREPVTTVATPCLLIARRRASRTRIVEILETILALQQEGNPDWQLLTIDNLRQSFEQYRHLYHPGVKRFLEEN